MSRRWIPVSLAVVLTLAFATALWAKPARHARTRSRAPIAAKAVPRTTVSPAPAAPSDATTPTRAGEHARCAATCDEVLPFYQHKYTTMSSHEGAPQCWSTCWGTYGNPLHPDASAATQELLWQELSTKNLRVSQCAQTCWDRHHPGATQEGILVAGVPSVPRTLFAWTPPSTTEVAQAAPEESAYVAVDEEPAPTEEAQPVEGVVPEATYPTEEARPAPVVIPDPSVDATSQYWSAGDYSPETSGRPGVLSYGGLSLGGAYGGTVFGGTPGGNSGLLTFPNDSSIATYPTYVPLFGTVTF
jgi:hypothetical protein